MALTAEFIDRRSPASSPEEAIRLFDLHQTGSSMKSILEGRLDERRLVEDRCGRARRFFDEAAHGARLRADFSTRGFAATPENIRLLRHYRLFESLLEGYSGNYDIDADASAAVLHDKFASLADLMEKLKTGTPTEDEKDFLLYFFDKLVASAEEGFNRINPY